ncbi:hypothetical protein F9L33_07685 [Amylibacter sp. SFDW26]|uniref:hypothetical protein n=1 Tax=Amylibacter sp. SFDW26 TaxID=2652722 RepID=UPI001261C49A|nr:hypothetical protein [Amylibacter sp. SFDW26]KAB7614513.1 hypothetical protein F9L33_07685 [Amylibacter sp. SFDW26]
MLPAFLLFGVSQSSIEFTRILATIVSIFVMYEYGFSSPSLIEFRFAAPYNRIRFLLLSVLVLAPTFLVGYTLAGANMVGFLPTIADKGIALLDFTYSPFMVVAETLSGENESLQAAFAQAIAFNTIIMFACITSFCVAIYLNLWRFGGSGFNMWQNMPTYKSYETKTLQERLMNSAFASLLIACLIPLLGPTVAEVIFVNFAESGQLAPIISIWCIAFWSFFQGVFFMRAAALAKIAINHSDKSDLVTA